MSSVGGGTLLEKGLRFCLRTVRLQELNELVGRKKKKACQNDLPVSYLLLMPKVLCEAGVGITGSQTQFPP